MIDKKIIEDEAILRYNDSRAVDAYCKLPFIEVGKTKSVCKVLLIGSTLMIC